MEKNKNLLLDMYRIAIVDGTLSREEMIVLNNYCYNNNISTDELTNISREGHRNKINIKDEKEKEKYLFDIVRVIISDGTIREEEIYLFNKITKSLRIKKDLSVLRKEIFRIIIDEFISKKKEEVKILENNLQREYELNILNQHEVNSIPIKQHESIVKNLISGYKNGEYGHTQKEKAISIFIIGMTELKKEDIKQILKKELEKNNYQMKEKDVFLCIGDKDYIKNHFSRYKQSIENGRFDLFIYGPHPHSLKGKPENISWESYLQNTNTLVLGNHNSSISKNKITRYLHDFFNKKR